MGAGNPGDAANVASFLPKDGVTFTLPNGYTVTVETMPRDDITDLALLTFARMGSVTSLEGIQSQAKEILIGLGKPSDTAEEIAQRVQSTFLNKPELASLMQHSIRNPRSGEEAWALASQVGSPTGPKEEDKLKVPPFPAEGTMEEQLDFVKQINLSNLATKLGISGFPRNAIKQTIRNKNKDEVSVVFGMGTPDNNDPVKARQVMESSKGGNPEQEVSFTGLLTEQGSLSAFFGNYLGFKTKDESNTDSLLRNNTLPKGVTARVVSAYGRNSLKRFGYSNGRKALRARVSEVAELASNPKHERYFRTMQSLRERARVKLFGMEDDRTIAIALASYVEREVNLANHKDVRIVNFCKSGKDRTGAEINMINAIGILDDQLKKEGKDENDNYKQPLDLNNQANMEQLADNYRMLQQTGVRNFISGLNSEGAGVLNGIELLPKAFKDYYERKGNDEGKKFLAELVVANALGKQNKGWDGDQLKKLQNKHDAILGELQAVDKKIEESKGLNESGNPFSSYEAKTERLKKESDTLRKCQDIYAKGLDALKTIKANYETRDVQMAALEVIEKKEGLISKFFTAIGLGGEPISSKDKAIARLEKEMNKKSKMLFGLIANPFSSHYSDAQKALMQQIIEGVKNETIGTNGSPADLFKQIQESKAKYDLDVVQQDALKVIKEVLSAQKTEAEIVPVSQIDRDIDLESDALLGQKHEDALTPEQAVIKGLKEIKAGYSSEQQALMQGVIDALTKGTMTLDGNSSDEDLPNQISGAIDGSGRATTVTNPLPRSGDPNTTHDSNNVVDFIPPHTEDERSEAALVTDPLPTEYAQKERGSLSSQLKVIKNNVTSSKERDQKLRGGVETGLDQRAKEEESLVYSSVKSLAEARTSMDKAMESVKEVSNSHEVGKENIELNENGENKHTRTSFGGRR